MCCRHLCAATFEMKIRLAVVLRSVSFGYTLQYNCNLVIRIFYIYCVNFVCVSVDSPALFCFIQGIFKALMFF